MGDWIKSSEQLPPKGEWVLGTTDNRQCPVVIIMNCGNGEYSSGMGWSTNEPPEYWMPLPESPLFPKTETQYRW